MNGEFSQDESIVHDFLVESQELLEGLDNDLVAMEGAAEDTELLNRIFRAMHTIKGTAGFLGFEPVVRLGHASEDVLNDLRKGDIKCCPEIMSALLDARDRLGRMLRDIAEGGIKTYDLEELLARLRSCRTAENKKDKLQEANSDAPVAATTRPAAAPAGTNTSHSMRVDVKKLDNLVNLIGELVLERNRLSRLANDIAASARVPEDMASSLTLSTGRLSFITEELQTAGLRARMVPIDGVFRKFPRLVRDVAASLGKEVALEISGEETEVDKTVVELIADPLVHLIRNSLDHGLEMPDVREAQGKKRTGTIRLEARQEGDHIIVAVADDGAGIDPDRILKKAIEKRLIAEELAPSLKRKDIFDLIFLPGFSTAEVVNDLSGRGVGMDVVRSNLKKLNGAIEISSELLAGTSTVLRLPLTLAILPVLLIGVRGAVYGLPLRSVVETSRVEPREIHRIEDQEVVLMRDETLPLLRLEQLTSPNDCAKSSNDDKLVVLCVGKDKFALAVDALLGQESTVIKPLGSYLNNCPGISGATVSGDGRVRLVLDPAALLASAKGIAQAAAV